MKDEMSDKIFEMLESVKDQIDAANKQGGLEQTLSYLIPWGEVLARASVAALKIENEFMIKYLENKTEQKKIESENKKEKDNGHSKSD